MRGIVTVAAALALVACGGGGSSGSTAPVGPNAQAENLVAPELLVAGGTSGIALGHPGVINDSGEAIVDLEFHRSGSPFSVDVFAPEGGWIPDGSGWVQPVPMGEGFYDVKATTESGRVLFAAFVFDVGVEEVVTID